MSDAYVHILSVYGFLHQWLAGVSILGISLYNIIFFIKEMIIAFFLLCGTFFLFVGAFGLVRLKSFWARIHAAGLIDTLGAQCILIACMLESGFTQASVKILFISVVLLIVSPTSTHALANAAYWGGVKPRAQTK